MALFDQVGAVKAGDDSIEISSDTVVFDAETTVDDQLAVATVSRDSIAVTCETAVDDQLKS